MLAQSSSKPAGNVERIARIAVLNVGLGGHLAPAVRLGRVLVAQGHQVETWGPEEYRERIEATGAEFREHQPVNAQVRSVVEFAAALAEASERSLAEIVEQLFRRRVDLVVHDVHVPWARLAADFLGLPRLVCHPFFPPSATEFASKSTADQTVAPDPGNDSAHSRIEASRIAIGRRWGMELGEWQGALLSTGTTTLSFSTPAMTGVDELPRGWHYVGPLMPPVVRPRPIETPRPLVYVAFGTASNISPKPFKLVINAMRGEPVDVLVATGRAPFCPSELGPLPANVQVRDYVDSPAVLSRADVHVTHGGSSSVHESLVAGVPMACLPQGSDQRPWSNRVAELGAGEIVDEDPTEVRRAVRRLLNDGSPRRRAHKIGEQLLAYPGERVVAEAISGLLGKSAKSPPERPPARPIPSLPLSAGPADRDS